MSGLPYRYPPQYNQPKPAATAPASMSTQRFCLRWNNHQSNLLSVFDQLLHDESFVDVTLAVEGQLLRAHKMVLSACSPYFQALFVNHPDKHPIVILKDVPYSDMKSLLDFMYRGEVSVDQDRLTHFLRVAESLRIKGLTEVNEEKCDNIASSLSQQNSNHVPNLQRIQQNKRIAGNFNMLGNYLMQPKRKRVQGSPEMLEVKMGMDGFTGSNSDGSTGKEEEDIKGVKEEPEEPIAGTSNDTRSAEEIQAGDDYTDYSQENNQNHTNLPSSITVNLEVYSPKQESVIISTEAARNMIAEQSVEIEDVYEESTIKLEQVTLESCLEAESVTGVHFLTDEESPKSEENYEKKKTEFLEYLPRADGSVVCKRCGEVLASRTHWYRHKYKLHVNNFISPAPLFKCELCNVFFKSRKGYTGHVSTRHPDSDLQPEQESQSLEEQNETNCCSATASNVVRRRQDKSVDWEEQRVKEEKLVADIIDRVRKECEAQGAAVTRRGYSRRNTSVMNINSAC
ncbi:longitudinals lacking protein, isoforms H/M/V-like isoform X2 [Cylas formicarius]|uniref:longitudinals lacking protein, isoforms H/M/V-like isoform X2 n=1 Tax=Cylas formicarius TaxID=197179 RepID=UPI0029587863|nr:longitudinals lacking protein, isoforms H/M/V-like isoform X2 [Cylas formicarius]